MLKVKMDKRENPPANDKQHDNLIKRDHISPNLDKKVIIIDNNNNNNNNNDNNI